MLCILSYLYEILIAWSDAKLKTKFTIDFNAQKLKHFLKGTDLDIHRYSNSIFPIEFSIWNWHDLKFYISEKNVSLFQKYEIQVVLIHFVDVLHNIENFHRLLQNILFDKILIFCLCCVAVSVCVCVCMLCTVRLVALISTILVHFLFRECYFDNIYTDTDTKCVLVFLFV